jgi:hypothetical protein
MQCFSIPTVSQYADQPNIFSAQGWKLPGKSALFNTMIFMGTSKNSSFPRKRESSLLIDWAPAFAGATIVNF